MSSTVSIIAARVPRSAGLQGAKVTPQLPIITVVTPCQLTGVSSGSQPIWASRWVWMSTKPGETISPAASISFLARAGLAADRGDVAIVDRHVADDGLSSGAVDDGSAADNDVMGHVSSSRANVFCQESKAGGTVGANDQ